MSILSALRRNNDRLWLAFFPPGVSGDGGRWGYRERLKEGERWEEDDGGSLERLPGSVELFDLDSAICRALKSSTKAEWWERPRLTEPPPPTT